MRSSVLRFVKRSTVECWRRVSCAVWVSLCPVGAACGELVDVQVPERLLWYRFRRRRMMVRERERKKKRGSPFSLGREGVMRVKGRWVRRSRRSS